MVIVILDEFFIQLSDALISFFIKVIDFIVFILDKFHNRRNLDNDNDLNDEINSNEAINLTNNRIFKLNDLLKNDSIFEELENRYLQESSSNGLNSSKDSQNIFSSLKGKSYENDGSMENRTNQNENNFLESIKEKLIGVLINNNFIQIDESNFYNSILRIIAIAFFILTLIVALISYFISLELGLAIFISILLIALSIFYYPKIKKQNEYASLSKELPYALRQLATELRSGRSLFDSLDSVASSDYGILSLEFSRVLEEIKYGESTENAFLNLERRADSKALSRTVYEILTSLRIGANLSNSLSIIADDVNFDIRMKLKEYSEKLNAFVMIYTFLAILAPVILLTMLLAASVVIGDLVPGDLILVFYSVFFPMIIVFLGLTIKKLEPKI
ncbi:type II secretion system F family protein [Methanobrevibacter ruminantium]|uniref:type II secretion system F family protein n=1 Tax=Methanobrevibacter ruminantium TaxID=83816 RepID=UPI0026EE0E21|nr:type II secretion system F family protein [Methanobrevibacter ruminantium]